MVGLREAAKAALECMEEAGVCVKASEALREALAEAAPIDSEERTGALGALNALSHENELPMSDRNGVLYDTIRAELTEAPTPYAYLVVQAGGFIVGGWKDRKTAESIAAKQLARDSETVVPVVLAKAPKADPVESAEAELTKEELHRIWHATDVVPGEPFAVTFLRAVLAHGKK